MANLKLLFVFILLLSLILSILSQIPRSVPEAYWGTAFVNGNPAIAGSKITVEVQNTGEIVGSGITGDNGLYSVDVIFDNELTPEDEGANEGEKLTWRIDGIPTDIPAPGDDIANSGGVNSNFNIFVNNGAKDVSPEFIALITAMLLIVILLILLKKKANGTS